MEHGVGTFTAHDLRRICRTALRNWLAKLGVADAVAERALNHAAPGTVQYGLIAEEVNQVFAELVIRDDAGAIQGVRYDELARR